MIASCVGGMPAIVNAVRGVDQGRARRLSPFTVPSFLANLAAGHISIRHGYKGPMGTPVTACAASVQAKGKPAQGRNWWRAPFTGGPGDLRTAL